MKSTQALCAKQIKEELKVKFPKGKFKVRSESFAGGDAVDIFWEDGPTDNEVNAIVKKYQWGYFDGMIDCYEANNVRDDIYQVKYVMTHREYSEKLKQLEEN